MAETPTYLKDLLETDSPNAERMALRREALETMRRTELEKEKEIATKRLNDSIRQDPRAVLVSDPAFARQRHQLTLRVGEQEEPITIQSDRMRAGPSGLTEVAHTDIYTGEASAQLEANPTDSPSVKPTEIVYDFLRSYRGTGSDPSLRDMQMDIQDILLVETLAEQCQPPADTVATAGRVGALAVQS